MTRVDLTPDELDFAALAGARRQRGMTGRGIPNPLIAPEAGGLQQHIDGVVAEIAFARLFNRYPPLSVRADCAHSYDFKINGKTIDTKATRRRGGMLMVPQGRKSEDQWDVYVLFVVDDLSATAVGWCEGVVLFGREPRVYRDGGPPTFALAQSELRPVFPELSAYLRAARANVPHGAHA